MDQVSLIPILLFVAALASAGIAVWRGPRPIDRSFAIGRLLRYLFVFPLGLQGLWVFVRHTFFGEEAAREIGWADTPFGPIAALSKISARIERGLAQIYFGGAASAMSAMTGR